MTDTNFQIDDIVVLKTNHELEKMRKKYGGDARFCVLTIIKKETSIFGQEMLRLKPYKNVSKKIISAYLPALYFKKINEGELNETSSN